MPGLVLQLDFDGTLTEGGVTQGILEHFLGYEWIERLEVASRTESRDPESPALIDFLKDAFSNLAGPVEDFVEYGLQHNPARPGLSELFVTANAVGFECHITSLGLEFLVRRYVHDAGRDQNVAIHCADLSPSDAGYVAEYRGPSDELVTAAWKQVWADHFKAQGAEIVYAGDGISDVAPALKASTVFARDGLLRAMPSSFAGTLRSFETLHDIVNGLQELYGRSHR